jgi:hypothetical protein
LKTVGVPEREILEEKSWTPAVVCERKIEDVGKKIVDTRSAGIKRHEVENERVLQEWSSEPS